jgi:multidrug efflux pump
VGNISLLPTGLMPKNIMMPLAEELSPVEDRGYFFTIAIAPEGSTPEFVSRASRGKEKVYEGMPDVRGYFVVAGYPDSTQGISFVPLKPYEERERHSSEISMEAMMGFFMIPEIIAFAMPPQSLGAGSSTPISVMLQTTSDYQELLRVGDLLVQKMNANSGLNQVRLDLRLNKPELQIDIDRQKAANLGVDVMSRVIKKALSNTMS